MDDRQVFVMKPLSVQQGTGPLRRRTVVKEWKGTSPRSVKAAHLLLMASYGLLPMWLALSCVFVHARGWHCTVHGSVRLSL